MLKIGVGAWVVLALAAAGAGWGQVVPADKAVGVSVNTGLQWEAVAGASGYEVFLGTSVPPGFQCQVEKNGFVLETLSANTTYYWQVRPAYADAKVKRVTPVTYSFTTEAKPSKEAVWAWPIRMAETIRGLYPQPANLGEWNYTQGMIADALVEIGVRTGRDGDIEYTKGWLDRFVNEDGTIKTWDSALHSLDRFRPGGAVLGCMSGRRRRSI